ncbi:MAG: putative 2-aminoethylphosphonate ABC transporter permease subunit [Halanaerobium sp.]
MELLKTGDLEIESSIYKKKVKQKTDINKLLQNILLILLILALFSFIILPLAQLFIKAFLSDTGEFIGFKNFIDYFSNPALSQSLYNTLFVSTTTALISVSLAFFYAFALSRTQMKWKVFFKYAAILPLFAPTMMHGISLIYLFGNQGMVTNILGIDIGLYGPVGIIISEIIYTFPQAFLILLISLSVTDNRLYEAAETLGAGTLKRFFTITLPQSKYGLISAFFLSFTMSFTDFGAPKVVGGNYNVLAVDIYKQVIGRHNMAMGATVGIILLLPAVIAFIVDQFAQKKESAVINSKSKPFKAEASKLKDNLSFAYCSLITAAIFIMFAAIILASLFKYWPYDLSLTLSRFTFENSAGSFSSFSNSVLVASATAVIGTIITFVGTYLIEKMRYLKSLRKVGYFLSILPMAVPGLVIGLSYIFFFNKAEFQLPFLDAVIANPFNGLYGTVFILVIANIVHFYAFSFLSGATALKKLDQEFESVSESMGVPFYKTFFKVTVPMSIDAILEIAMYYFVNSMVTISAVMFIYSADWKLASIDIVNMQDAGDISSAAAMSVLIFLINITVRIGYEFTAAKINKKRSSNNE